MIKVRKDEIIQNDVLNGFPYFSPDRISFKREEKNGYISIHSKYAPKLHELFLNSTTQIILEKCTGDNDVIHIIDELTALFVNVSKEEIKEDVIDTLMSLYQYQLVTWKGEDPFMYSLIEIVDGRKFHSVGEADIRKILKFVTDNINESSVLQYMHPLSLKEIYMDELYLRETLFNYEEDFYFIEDKEEITGLISLRYSKSVKSSVSSVGIILCKPEDLKFTCKCLTEFATSISLRNVSKIKLQLV